MDILNGGRGAAFRSHGDLQFPGRISVPLHRNQLGAMLVSSNEACGAPAFCHVVQRYRIACRCSSPPTAASLGDMPGMVPGRPPTADGSFMPGPTRRVTVITGITISRQVSEQRPEAGSGTFHAGELSGRPR